MTTGITASVATHLREPMRRSAYALVAATGLTSILGMAFWVLTARLLPAEAVGTGAALISAMTFLGTLSTLGLRNALVRFLAPAGASARRLIVTCYLLCAAAAILAAAVFVAGQPWWASKLDFLHQDPLLAVAFVAATAVWVLFILEDHVLIGLRRAGWVPITKGIYSAIKIALLPALVSGTAYGLFAVFALPAAPIVVLVTVLVLKVASQQRGTVDTENLRMGHLVRFAIADHSSALLWLATTELLTLVVLQKTDAEASAYYFMSFTIAYSLFLVTSNVGSAFVAEAVRYPARAVALATEALRHAASLVVPLSLVGVVLTPLALHIFGQQYATNGTVLLRLLLLSAIPQVVIGIALGAARVRRDNRLILAVYAAQAVGVFGGTILTIDRWGLAGVGLSWLITQTTVALVLVLTRRTGTESGAIDLGGAIDWAGKVVSHIRRLRNRRLTRHVVAPALRVCGLAPHTEYRLLPSESDSLILALEDRPEPRVLKIATTHAASRGLDRHADTLSQLRHSLGSSELLTLIPRVLERRAVEGRTVLLETRLPGVTNNGRAPEVAGLEAAAAAIAELHRSTGAEVTVDRTLMRDWVDTPIAKLRRIKALNGLNFAFARLADILYGALLGQRVITSHIHGDYWLGNIMLLPDGSQVTGIVDWENARPVGLPDCDLIHLWLTSQPGDLGVTVRRAVLSPDTIETAVDRLGSSWSNPQLPTGPLVLLAWLWHVTAELERASRNRVGRLWLARTVKPVLDLVNLRRSSQPLSAVALSPGQSEATAVPAKWQISLAVLQSDWLLVALPIAAVALWVLGLAGADPRAMNDLGLLSLFGPANVAALMVLAIGVIIGLHRGVRERLLALQLVSFLALIHATPAVLYGTLRYSWAWKHVGIVDYILRHGSVDPTINVSAIYHNWPGFFGASALLTAIAGRENLLTIASWAPFAFNLMNLFVLRFVLRGLTENKRLVWLSLWLFFLINWVGQDYFSPQAMAFVLYLACIGLVLRGVTAWRAAALFALLAAIIAVSHQITPVVLIIAVTTLVVLKRTPGWYLPIITILITVTWALTYARPYTLAHFPDMMETFGQLLGNTSEALEKATVTTSAQALVVWGGRGVVAVSGSVAVIGVWKCWRNRTLQVNAAILMFVPGILVVITGFGGEVLLRAFFFAAPFIAFNAATAIIPERTGKLSTRASVATAVLTAVLLPGFLLGYYGKERQNYFTPQEVQAATWVSEHARPGSLLVEGSRNYPAQFRNYENFTYVPIDREPEESWSRIVADPAGVLSEWLDDPRYTNSYVLITRSQKTEVDAQGSMPTGSIQSIENALRRSPEFQVALDTGDATVFVLRTG